MVLVVVACLVGMIWAQGEDRVKKLVDFQDAEESRQWRIVNDGVMGGLSRSTLEMTGAGTAIFSGQVSLENYGGFASVRTFSMDFSLEGFSGFRLRVRGDGKSYHMRARTDDGFDGIAYDRSFETGSGGEWEEVQLPFDSFQPQFRGRMVPGAPPLEAARIRQIGVLISDKQEGPFQLEIDWIAAYR